MKALVVVLGVWVDVWVIVCGTVGGIACGWMDGWVGRSQLYAGTSLTHRGK